MSTPYAPPPAWQPVAPPPPPRRRWILPVIIAGAVLVVGIAIAVGIALTSIFSQLSSSLLEGPYEESLVSGPPGSPIATTPLECEGACFTAASLLAAVAPESAFVAAGVPDNTYPMGTYSPVAGGELYRGVAQDWEAYGGAPDECFFVLASAPYAAEIDDANAESTDTVHFMGTHQDADRLNTLDQAARIFPDTVAATAYMATLAQNIDACTSIEMGPPGRRDRAFVDPAAGLTVPDSVAAVGWIREGTPGPRWRAYISDIQYGNIVMRVRLLTDGSISESSFRLFAEERAHQLADISPEGVPIAG